MGGKAGRALVLSGLIGLIGLAGCGADPVRQDLETYAKTVLAPVEAVEHDGGRKLAAALDRIERGELTAADARRLYGAELAAQYEALVRDTLEVRQPATPPVSAFHRKVIAHYRAITADLEAAASALAKADRTAAAGAHARLAARPFTPLRQELAALCAAHGLELTDPKR